jgi:hypothetical protein
MSTNADLEQGGSGVGGGTSTGEAATTNQGQPNRQSSNWQDDPKYRELQAERDAREAALAKQVWESQQQMNQMKYAIQQMQLQGLEGEQLLAAQLQLTQQQLAEVQRERDLAAFAVQRQRDLEDIVRRTGVPMKDIENAPNVHVAWQIGADYKDKSGKGAAQATEDSTRQPNDDVDVGGGKPMGKSAALQSEYDAARKDFNFSKTLEAMAKASQQGVTLREW